MFTTSVGRVVRSTSAASTASPASTAASAAILVRPLRRTAAPHHQRRLSSSKTSVPPDGSKRIAPEQQTAKSVKSASSTGRKGRKNRKHGPTLAQQAKTTSLEFSKQFPFLPVVKPTSHLKPDELALSSFFALHRPISIGHVLPDAVSTAEFNKLFQPRSQKEKHDDVLFTLGSAVHNLEDATGDLTYDFDAYGNLASGVPYRPPPPPEPLTEQSQKRKARKSSQQQLRKQTTRREGKSWQTTIVVTEYTEANGEQTFEAETGPMIRLPVNETAEVAEPRANPRGTVRLPFMQRMRAREVRWLAARGKSMRPPTRKPRMMLISVKRQRKHKMKKHKLKKLRKRTKSLRRKLGKL